MESSSTLTFQIPILGIRLQSFRVRNALQAPHSRFASSYLLRTTKTPRSRVVVSCTAPFVSTSDSSQGPESYVIHTKDDVQVVLPPNTELVSLPLPLGVFLDQTAEGVVFVDELEPDGNAAKLGGLGEGDVIQAVSLPFGTGLFPVPKIDGVQMIAEYMASRNPEERFFHMAVRRGNDVEGLRARLRSETDILTADSALRLATKMQVDEYPVTPPEEMEGEEEDFATRMNQLKEYGFDMGSITEVYRENGTD